MNVTALVQSERQDEPKQQQSSANLPQHLQNLSNESPALFHGWLSPGTTGRWRRIYARRRCDHSARNEESHRTRKRTELRIRRRHSPIEKAGESEIAHNVSVAHNQSIEKYVLKFLISRDLKPIPHCSFLFVPLNGDRENNLAWWRLLRISR
jgi:hypothetical protein